jgi:hypothetical protein
MTCSEFLGLHKLNKIYPVKSVTDLRQACFSKHYDLFI